MIVSSPPFFGFSYLQFSYFSTFLFPFFAGPPPVLFDNTFVFGSCFFHMSPPTQQDPLLRTSLHVRFFSNGCLASPPSVRFPFFRAQNNSTELAARGPFFSLHFFLSLPLFVAFFRHFFPPGSQGATSFEKSSLMGNLFRQTSLFPPSGRVVVFLLPCSVCPLPFSLFPVPIRLYGSFSDAS